MRYIDTSVLVSALTNEGASDRARAALTGTPAGDLALSGWTITEFSSALALKLRMGQIDRVARAGVLTGFTRLVADSFDMLPVGPAEFAAAAALCNRSDLAIRAGDALHLAIAMTHGAVLVTLDLRLAEAALIAGAAVDDCGQAGR